MVQHSGNEVTSRLTSSSSHLAKSYHLTVRHPDRDVPERFEDIVSQVVDELCEVAQRNPIARVVVYGARCHQVQSLMSRHPQMPRSVSLNAVPEPRTSGKPSVARDDSTEEPFTVYRIDTDYYPFSSRF